MTEPQKVLQYFWVWIYAEHLTQDLFSITNATQITQT